jgi:hypothetical protein
MKTKILGLFLLIMSVQSSYAQPTETIKTSTGNTRSYSEHVW